MLKTNYLALLILSVSFTDADSEYIPNMQLHTSLFQYIQFVQVKKCWQEIKGGAYIIPQWLQIWFYQILIYHIHFLKHKIS